MDLTTDVIIIILCLFILATLIFWIRNNRKDNQMLTPKMYRKFVDRELENKSPDEMMARCREIIATTDNIFDKAAAQWALYYLEHPEAIDKRSGSVNKKRIFF